MTDIKLLLIFAVGIFTFNLINCLNIFFYHVRVITESVKLCMTLHYLLDIICVKFVFNFCVKL